jgi:PAS domain S-box-containing protein
MPDALITKRLHRRILIYSTIGMLLVGLAVGLVGVLPLTERLREAQRRNLLVDLQKQTTAIERFVSRARNTAVGSGSRTRIREAMTSLAEGALNREQLLSVVMPLVDEGLAQVTNIAGVIIFDRSSNVVLQAGAVIPPAHWLWADSGPREADVGSPIVLSNQVYLVAAADITGTNLARVGHIMVLLHTTGLRRIIEDYTDLGRTGETILGSRAHKTLPVFFPFRKTRSDRPVPAVRVTTIMEGLRHGESNPGTMFEPEAPKDESLIMAVGAVPGVPWNVVVVMDKAELFSGVNRGLWTLGSAIVACILLATGGMFVLLRPLAGRIILQTDELESEIYQKTAALNTELSERKRAENKLRDSEVMYHSLVDTLPISILRKDLRGRVTYGNRGYCERMGRPLRELVGRTDYDLFPKELADKYLNDDEKVVRTGDIFEDVEEHRTPDGKRTYVHVLKAPVRDAEGKTIGTQVIFWDVTARKLAEEALAKANEDLARSNKELEQFAYVASHDLQEPLRMVTSYTQLIAHRYEDKLDKDAKEFMTFAVEGALRMQRLILGLLEYSRIGSKARPFETVDANDALDSALANLAVSIDEANAVVTRDTLPVVFGDSLQLAQLFQNLISNALKFRGTVPPQIHVAARRETSSGSKQTAITCAEWIFSVRDNGLGIEPQYFDRIFVIFQRLHTPDQYHGTGIGLAICKKIVERHGGRIWLESTPGRGTTFSFTLPANEVETRS